MDIQKVANASKVITIGSYWDLHEVYSKVYCDMRYFNQLDYGRLDFVYSRLLKYLTAPHMFVRMKTDVIHCQSYLELTDRERMQEDYLLRVFEGFDTLAQKIRVPVIEIDATDRIEDMYDNLTYGMNSVEASRSSSIWENRVFRAEGSGDDGD
jgi:hypothetical protein